jgi:hypothetical protein
MPTDFDRSIDRRRLRSAERLSDRAMLRGLAFEKTPFSRSSALLVSVTFCDHRFRLVRPIHHSDPISPCVVEEPTPEH